MRRMDVALNPGMRTLNLALQGGGSHGAFTWGVLDALLADARIALEGLSGTSAGAVNAVALASGYCKGLGRRPAIRASRARDSLARVWDEVAAWAAWARCSERVAAMLWGGLPTELAPTNIISECLARPVVALPDQPAGHQSAARPAGARNRLRGHRRAPTSSRSSFPPRM